jgi:hypothetical protein
MAKAKQPKAKRLTPAEREQQFIPELAPEKNPKIHKLGLLFIEASENAALAAKAKKEAGLTLVFEMESQKVDRYVYGDLDLRCVQEHKAKAKRIVAKREKKTRKKKGDEAPAEEAKAA